jgi:lambda family phage minor tail protein L
MAQGQNRIASGLLELEPTAIIELFLLYFNTVDNPNAFIAFHGGSVYNQGIVWQGIEYLPIPVETDGFEVNANGQLSRPKMRISNKDYFATDLLLNNDDLQFAKVIRKRTFVKYLDDVNFDGGNPWGEADASAELSNDTFVVGQKTAENKVFIELELTSPLDLENFEVNNRLIMSRYCSWHYRGNGCNYNGIPLATEEGESLIVGDPIDWFTNQALKEWSAQRYYSSGDAAYLENKKITIANLSNSSQSEFAKIWYVCQANHSGSSLTIPDKNQSLWKRDGCNKKLDGCQLRFGKGSLEFGEKTVQRTANFVDFTSRASFSKTNDIAYEIAYRSAISGSSESAGSSVYSVADQFIGAGASSWKTTGTAKTGAMVGLEWPTPRNINRIDIYDNIDAQSNFNNAYIRLFDINNTVIRSGTLAVGTAGQRSTTGFASILVKKIIISGSGVAGTGPPSLSEVAVFETNSPHLVYNDQEALALHRNNFFQISTWIGFTNRDSHLSKIYSVFNNISGNCRYSGINLYASGQNLLLDFSTRTTGASAQQNNRTLTIPWSNDQLRPLHLICSGGVATGISPTAASAGYIELSDGASHTGRYILSGSVGEYFRFKNPNYQSGIVGNQYRFKFGINDWQFPTGSEFTSNPLPESISNLTSNIKIISPIKFGPTVFWTGANGVDVRITEASQSVFKDYPDFTGRSANTTDLLGWWEMLINDGASGISGMNNSSKKLVISGDSPSTFQSSSVGSVLVTEIINRGKQSIDLPFGGFPGTEKYG